MAEAKTIFSKVAAPRRGGGVQLLNWEMARNLLVILVVLTGVSVFHVWSRFRIVELNLGISEAKRLLKEEQQKNNQLKLEVASLKTPARIESLAKGELGMALPTDQQVIVVK